MARSAAFLRRPVPTERHAREEADQHAIRIFRSVRDDCRVIPMYPDNYFAFSGTMRTTRAISGLHSARLYQKQCLRMLTDIEMAPAAGNDQQRVAVSARLSHHRHERHRNYGPLFYATVRELIDDYQTLGERAATDRRNHYAAGPELI